MVNVQFGVTVVIILVQRIHSGAEAQVVTLSPTSPTVVNHSPLVLTCETQSTNVEHVVWTRRISDAAIAVGTIIIRSDNNCAPPFPSLAPNPSIYDYACPLHNRVSITIKNVSRSENGVGWKCVMRIEGKNLESTEVTIAVQGNKLVAY
ncbi:uncharacterized protein LOC128234941 [Mya arenaria]|uniref:uncharacterized protein LOC128234941 n=1 Tax=Mya arenaria TaxID=6604 RepID=UPI0022DF74A2|nr:uncharacterized protein LOC128234941 [Mya arenaria]